MGSFRVIKTNFIQTSRILSRKININLIKTKYILCNKNKFQIDSQEELKSKTS